LDQFRLAEVPLDSWPVLIIYILIDKNNDQIKRDGRKYKKTHWQDCVRVRASFTSAPPKFYLYFFFTINWRRDFLLLFQPLFVLQLLSVPSWKADDGKNALHFLCRYYSSRRLIDEIKLLIDLKIDVNEKDNDGRNALHLLVVQDSSESLVDAINPTRDGDQRDRQYNNKKNIMPITQQYTI
jgi:hypothetical protein